MSEWSLEFSVSHLQGEKTTGVKLEKIYGEINFRSRETNTVEKMILINMVSVCSDKWML